MRKAVSSWRTGGDKRGGGRRRRRGWTSPNSSSPPRLCRRRRARALSQRDTAASFQSPQPRRGRQPLSARLPRSRRRHLRLSSTTPLALLPPRREPIPAKGPRVLPLQQKNRGQGSPSATHSTTHERGPIKSRCRAHGSKGASPVSVCRRFVCHVSRPRRRALSVDGGGWDAEPAQHPVDHAREEWPNLCTSGTSPADAAERCLVT